MRETHPTGATDFFGAGGFMKRLLISLVTSALVCGCGGSQGAPPAPPPPPAITVSISPQPPSVQVNGSAQFTATVTNDSSNKGVTWSLTGASCTGAACGMLSSTTSNATTYTAPLSPPSPNASVMLTASSVTDSTKSFSLTFSITSAVDGVSVSPKTATVQLNSMLHFVASVTPITASQAVTWTLSGASCAATACGTLNSASANPVIYTGPANLPSPNASVTLTATSITDSSKSDSATITLVPPISVVVSPKPSSIQAFTTMPFTATVSNDLQNQGVNWTVTGPFCSGVTCGSVAPTTTASGAPTTYMAPMNPPSPNPSVTVTATSITDPTKSDSATFNIVTINPNLSSLNGQYAFVFSGFDSSGSQVVKAGTFIADGTGNISGGVQDVNRTTGPTKNQPITGTYNVNSDSRGSMSLGGVIYRFALSNFVSGVATRARFVEFDPNDSTGTEGSGVIEKQDTGAFSLAAIAGDFAFGGAGNDNSGKRTAIAGRLTVDSSGTVSNGGIDIATPGTNLSTVLSGSFGDPGGGTLSSFGRLIATLTPAGQNTGNFIFYIVSASEMFFVDVDLASNNIAHFAGTAMKQSGGPFSNASANGNMVFNVTGADAAVAGGSNVTIGQVTADGAGNITSGFLDQNEGGTIPPSLPVSFTGTYSISGNGRGTVAFVINPTNSKLFTFYVVTQNTAYLLDGVPPPGTPSSDVQFGFIEPQSVGPFSNQSVAGNFSSGTVAPPTKSISNSSGVFTLDASKDTINGTIDETKSSSLLIPDEAITGTYGVISVGRAAVTITSGGGGNAVFWIINSNKFVLLISVNTGDTKAALVILERQ